VKKIILTFCALGATLSLLFLCSCTTKPQPSATKLPIEVSINKEAGRGGLLIVMLSLNNEELPFVLDTGSGGSCFDTSLEPKLGKPIGTETIQQWGKFSKKNAYAMPKLYLGSVPLQTGNRVLTTDLKGLPSFLDRPIMGMLGMDVLGHYCIQLDFTAGKMRLLNGQQAGKSSCGRAFPIVALNANDTRPAVAGNLFGAEGPHSLIDSGFDTGGWLMPQFYRQWTNQAIAPAGIGARQPDGRFFGENYPQINLREENAESDGIGLSFLARHLVTLDFPGHTLYLKRTSDGPLPNIGVIAAMSYLKNLKDQGELPGWSKEEHGKPKNAIFDPSGKNVTIDTMKDRDSSTYHYLVLHAPNGSSWKLQRAWRTDENGKTIVEFPVP
jgi:hypothetical protein